MLPFVMSASHLRVLVQVLGILFLIQLPVELPGKALKDAHKLGPLPPVGETQMDFLVSGFGQSKFGFLAIKLMNW